MSQKSASRKGAQKADDIRLSSLTHDEDGVPVKWLRLMCGGPVKGGLSKQDQEEILGVCNALEKKGKYQKAANLIYYCVAGDSNNQELRRRWDSLVAKTNEARREDIERRKKEEEAERNRPVTVKASLSETQQWSFLRQKGRLPEDTPNWHLNKLKPWKAPDALSLGNQHKQRAGTVADPFKKVFELEEACKMYNKVLEVKPDSEEARAALNSCIAQMNSQYMKMKSVKRETRRLDPELPMTKPGDFLLSKNEWVQQCRHKR
mmetsp:Transcript_28965/g.81572  ORF Transcript_28965/g.81572 Transcript_28965/m.81572 type:complete len:262 (-) Transcript_28965:422-1207(-)